MESEDGPETGLTPEQEAQLRRLLADARHTDPMPASVATRLDRVLTGLAEEPARREKVIRLAERRRRVTRLLVAAAAVVVVGVGGAQLVGNLDGAGSPSAGNAQSDAEEAVPRAGAEAHAGDAPGGGDHADADEEPTTSSGRPEAPAKIRAQAFALDTATLRDRSRAGDYSLPERNELSDDCPTGAWGAGRYVAVRYAGDPGWIVFRRPEGDTQVADLFLCGTELARRSLTLPYP